MKKALMLTHHTMTCPPSQIFFLKAYSVLDKVKSLNHDNNENSMHRKTEKQIHLYSELVTKALANSSLIM